MNPHIFITSGLGVPLPTGPCTILFDIWFLYYFELMYINVRILMYVHIRFVVCT